MPKTIYKFVRVDGKSKMFGIRVQKYKIKLKNKIFYELCNERKIVFKRFFYHV